jgi:hypothetical protein
MAGPNETLFERIPMARSQGSTPEDPANSLPERREDRFSPRVHAVLKNAGWHGLRRADCEWSFNALRAAGFHLSQHAMRILRTFHGLRFETIPKPGNAWNPGVIEFDPVRVARLMDDSAFFWEKQLATRLSPIGSFSDENLLLLATDGHVFGLC